MTRLVEAVACAQVFADYPFHLEWRDVRQHMGRLPGATMLHMSRDDEPCMVFNYKDHHFVIQERSRRLEFSTERCVGVGPLIAQVEAHFTALLAPDLVG